MTVRRWLILGSIVAGLQVFSVAQDQSTQNPTTQSSGDNGVGNTPVPAGVLTGIASMLPEGGAEDTNSDLPQIPALLGGQGLSTASLSEMKKSNYLRGGVNVSVAYDDNPLLVSSGAESNTSESMFPNIRIDESTSRMRWSLGYAGGLTVNQKITTQNQGSHNLSFDSESRLSPHVNLRVAENFALTTGFFDAGNGTETIGSLGGPNASLITPLATQRSNNTTVETNYRFALNDMVGASGSFYDLNFTNVPAGTQLTNSQTASGSAFWLHRTFHDDWSGVSYRFDRIAYNSGSEETLVHSFLAVNTLSLWKRLTLTGFVGPQYSESQGLAPGATLSSQSNTWSMSGGVDGGWHSERAGVGAGYSRSISDGGGVLGTVRLQNIHGNFRCLVMPGWAVALMASRGTNQSITVPFATSANSINVTSAGISLDRNVGKSVGLRLSYTHDFQEQLGVPGATQTFDANRNRVVITLSYQWAKPLGM